MCRNVHIIQWLQLVKPLNMSLPGTASIQAEDQRLRKAAKETGDQLNYLLKNDLKPRDIMTREAFHNAITTVLSLGGSTNAVFIC